jgi:hypothetical protein
MTKDEKLEKIQDALWRRTQRDWVLAVHHILTEPVCPSATIQCEDDEAKYQYWRADRDTIDEAIDAVIAYAYAGLFERSEAIGVPWTEPTLRPVPQEEATNG